MIAACRLFNCRTILTGSTHWDAEMRRQFGKRFGKLTTQHKWWQRGYLTERGEFVLEAVVVPKSAADG